MNEDGVGRAVLWMGGKLMGTPSEFSPLNGREPIFNCGLSFAGPAIYSELYLYSIQIILLLLLLLSMDQATSEHIHIVPVLNGIECRVLDSRSGWPRVLHGS